jgi:hypothetical protein
MKYRKDIITISMSALALIVSLFSVYWSQFRSADIKAVSGEWANTGYFNESKVFWLALPVTFTNYGARTATVRKIALFIQTPDRKKSYLLESGSFQKIGESGDFVAESVPVPIAVPPGESVNKIVQFISSTKNPSEFEIVEIMGSYEAKLLGWTTTSEKPDLQEKLTFELGSDELATLKKDRAGEPGVGRFYQSQYSGYRAQSLGDEDIKNLLE